MLCFLEEQLQDLSVCNSKLFSGKQKVLQCMYNVCTMYVKLTGDALDPVCQPILYYVPQSHKDIPEDI